MKLTKKTYRMGDMHACYWTDADSGQMFLALLPQGLEDCYPSRRITVQTQEFEHVAFRFPAWQAGSLCHVAIAECAQGTAAGRTLKHGPCTASLRYVNQTVEVSGTETAITTQLRSAFGFSITHTLRYTRGERCVAMHTAFTNDTDHALTLELLTTFALDNLSAFDPEASANRLRLHRFHGGWSLEGKPDVRTVEALSLDRAWHASYPESERFGSLGGWTTGKWFPQAAVEDRVSGVIWAAQLACAGSWQMELSRLDDGYSFTGGLADREMGHWSKRVAPGETFDTPDAWLTVAQGQPMQAWNRLTSRTPSHPQPEAERGLPWIFNEWCTSWGDPTEQEIRTYAALLQNTAVNALVIDAGWFQRHKAAMGQSGCGDWAVAPERFPGGLRRLSEDVAAMGFRLGLWVELEVTTEGAAVHGAPWQALHLQRDGRVIASGETRAFWDFRNPQVTAYLRTHVIELLRANRITYLKIDDNGNPGYGCDGAESPGEGMRQQTEAVVRFWESMRAVLPDLVIENCAAGGSRLSAPFTDLGALSSVTDAHESIAIPCIAANMHALLVPARCLLWVVLWRSLSAQQVEYRLCSAMLGRACLSGGLTDLHAWQWERLREAMAFYTRIRPILAEGESLGIYGNRDNNMLHPKGVQAVLRMGANGELLLVCHSVETPQGGALEIPLPYPARICKVFGNAESLHLSEDKATVCFAEPLRAFACLLVPAGQERFSCR